MSLHPATALTQEAWDFGERDHWPLKRTPGAAEISADLERWFGLLGTSIVIKAGKATLTGTLQIDIDIDSASPRASLSGRELEGGLAPSSRVTASPASTRDPTPDPLGAPLWTRYFSCSLTERGNSTTPTAGTQVPRTGRAVLGGS
jgi:hypothetical protein